MFLRALILWIVLGLPAFGQALPSPLSDTISDFAGLLPPDDSARLDAALRAGRRDTGVQVVVVTMNRIADHGGAGQRIEDYAKALFNQWGVGSSQRNDGIMILVAREDREMRIALGAGYEVIWDNAAQRVIDRAMLPAFRDDRYVDGIEAGIAATYDMIVRPHRDGAPPPQVSESSDDIFGLVAFLAVAAVFGTAMLRDTIGALVVRFRACPACGARALRRRRTVLTQATKTSTGLVEIHTTCSACAHDEVQTRTTSRLSSGSSSGGFGGGSSSGGGATGRW